MQLSEDKEIDIQEKVVGFIEQVQAVPKMLWVMLIVFLILAVPMATFLRFAFSSVLIAAYDPPPITYTPPQAKDIEINAQKVLPVSEDRFFAFAKIFNPNTDLSVRKLAYKFSFRDNTGQLLGMEEGTSYILPGQDKLLITPARRFGQMPTRLEVELTPENWSRTTGLEPLNFRFENVNFGRDEDGRFFVAALLNNDNPFIVPEVELGVILYSLNREIIGVNYTTLNNLNAYESRFFRVVWPSGVVGQVADVEFQPAVNLLKQDALSSGSANQFDEFDPRR